MPVLCFLILILNPLCAKARTSAYTLTLFNLSLFLSPQMTPFIFCIIPADISTVLCDKQNKAESLLQNREKGQTPVLKTIVIMDPFDAELVTRGAQCGLEVLSLADVEVGEVRHTLAAVRMASSLCSD